MLHIVLFQPEIPPNTGNIIRLCANTGYKLHLIEPLGFAWDDKRVRRAGLDYHEFADVRRYPDLASCLATLPHSRVFACTTKGKRYPSDCQFRAGDVLLFGPETRGLPTDVLDNLPPEQRLRLPMRPGNRSLNLSNSIAVVVFEAWRQMDFAGGA